MTVHSRHTRGHLLYWDTHRKRIVAAIGHDVIEYHLRSEILNATTVDPSGFTTTVVEVGTGTTEFNVSDTEGIIGRITCAADEDDGGSYQLLGENFVFDGDHDIYCSLRLAINDADQSDFLFGLCITDTSLLGGLTDGVYFESLDGSTDISIVAEKGGSETTGGTTGTLVDAAVIHLEFYWDGTTLEAFIDGVSIYGPTAPANIPDDQELRLSLEFLTGEGIANTMDVISMDVIQIGRS